MADDVFENVEERYNFELSHENKFTVSLKPQNLINFSLEVSPRFHEN